MILEALKKKVFWQKWEACREMDQGVALRGLEPTNSTLSSIVGKYPFLHGIWIKSSIASRPSLQGTQANLKQHRGSRSYPTRANWCARRRTTKCSHSVGQIPANLRRYHDKAIRPLAFAVGDLVLRCIYLRKDAQAIVTKGRTLHSRGSNSARLLPTNTVGRYSNWKLLEHQTPQESLLLVAP